MRHTISILVENRFGVLTRVAGMFSGRGFNIDSLNVAPTNDPSTSRMTIVVRGDDTVLGLLTDREFEVFQAIGQGLTTGEIGRRLSMSGKTVETHRLHIRGKLGCKTSPELIKYAVRWAGTQGLI